MLEQLKVNDYLTSHNSYLPWHAEWGLGAFIVLLFILKSCWRMLKSHKRLVFFMFVLALFAATDNLLFTGTLLFTLPLIYIFTLGDSSFEKKIYYGT